MLATTEGIVLHLIKYGDSSAIASVYTQKFGRQSFFMHSARGKKSKNKTAILQPLFLVDIVCYHKENREIQRIKEIRNIPAYQNIPFDVVKSAQVFFIAEVLSKVLREQESSPPLFNFIKNALMFFDLMEGNSASFHLWFLLHLTEYIGFLPDLRKNGSEGWFDMRKGAVVRFEPTHPFIANKEATSFLCILADLKIQNIQSVKITKNIRSYLTSKLVEYYQIHFETLGEIKSLKVLQEVFG